jgi:hypothetical protein
MNGKTIAASAMMDMTKRNDMIIVCPDRKTGTGTAVMDFSRRFAKIQIAAYDTAKGCNSG